MRRRRSPTRQPSPTCRSDHGYAWRCMDDIHLFIRAVDFAAAKHRNQRRKDEEASPYINHPIALTRVLKVEAGGADTDVLSAALLHDTIEDTETTRDELEREFGARIAGIVAEVSDDT